MKLKLDQETVVELRLDPGRNEDFVWDTALEGYGLRLRHGAKGLRRTYVAQYRVNGHTRRVTLGSSERLTELEARKGARKALARATLGDDPQGEKVAKRAAAERTFAKVVDVYLADKEDARRPTTNRLAELYLRRGSYFRTLHAKGIGEISHADVAARLTAIKNSRSSHTAAAARRALSALFTWAMEEGLVGANPVVGTRKPAEAKSRDRVLSDAELVAIWNACDDDDYGRIVRLLILLGARRKEIGGICWREFDDLDTGIWTLPAERSKNKVANTITLSAPALKIVRAASDLRFQSLMRQHDGRDHLFGARGGKAGYAAWDHSKKALDRRLGKAVASWRLHDLRRSVATKMADIGVEPHIIEAALNHRSGHRRGVASVYNRSTYEPQVKAALARWAAHLMVLVEGRGGDNVVELRA
jgi:integrase